MPSQTETPSSTPPAASPAAGLPRDLTAGLVVFLVALPLCLGVALASGAPLISGLIAGIVGGIVVGLLSGSHSSVSGPAAGLTAVVFAQIASLGSFQTFLLAVVLAGAMQVALGLARAGFLAAFMPSSVIKGLLAAIGVILILKQIPHVVGHDKDPEGEMSFVQPDQETTFTEIAGLFDDFQLGATVIGLASILILVVWDKWKLLKKSPVPSALVVVLFGVAANLVFQTVGGTWLVEASHLVNVPGDGGIAGLLGLLQHPDFGQLGNKAVWVAAGTIAAVASLETLLNLEAVDKLDPRQRTSPPSRELVAQGVGNMAAGLIGGIPITSVIVRSSVNINAGARSKVSAIFHGILLLVSVAAFPAYLNMIPLSCLAAILLVTGIKLASPALVKQMWREGKTQFIPFMVTIVAIVLTDLLVGVMLGLAVSVGFILWSNVRRPVRVIREKHLGGEVLHIELANQVSFLNRAALAQTFDAVPAGGHVLIDARNTDYIDADVLSLIHEFDETQAPARGVEVSLVGFKSKYQFEDRTQFVDYSSRDVQASLTPALVLQILKDGNARFRSGNRLSRDLGRQVAATAAGQHPFAAVLSCIDSRAPVELVFDLGVGDIFSARVAGNVTSRKLIGSIEYATAVAGAKLVVVMGHTRCGAVAAAADFARAGQTAAAATGCGHLDHVLTDIQHSVDVSAAAAAERWSPEEREAYMTAVARKNVLRSVETMLRESACMAGLVKAGRLAIVGALYDVTTGGVEFLGTAAGGAV